ncbi:MAG TPA: PQQ-dependent sugar dehydrogenase [Tepidisphaeraceae bacterium]|jgi:glucose/arabinose dehydrogenase|nr:PQQ-dependent sugar dehydrogenase [Tepidisphaeraceae bacterium]
MSRSRLTFTCIVLIALPIVASACRSLDKPADGKGVAFQPARRDFSQERMEQLKVPDGLKVNVFAKLDGEPRMLTTADDGTVYVTRRKNGDVLALRDGNGDGVADEPRTVVSGLKDVHGITLHDGKMYLASPTKLWAAPMKADGTVGDPKLLLDDLPEAGRHGNRTMKFGSDGKLYLSVGSSSNAEPEKNPEHATILRLNPDGTGREIFARGLRNTIGFGWHPQTGQMWGMDHGSDWRGDTVPPEELNRLQEGKDYGWPFVYGDRVVDPITDGDPPRGLSRQAYAQQTEPAVLTYKAHAAPMQMAFQAGDGLGADYNGDAFIPMRGSWNRGDPVGYSVARIRFDDSGQPTALEPFVTGWLIEDGKAHFARLAGLTIAKDGAILISDDTNGVIYRIARR